MGLVKCLINKAFKINNAWMRSHLDLKEVIHVLKWNCYPERTNIYLNSKYVDNNIENKREPLEVFNV